MDYSEIPFSQVAEKNRGQLLSWQQLVNPLAAQEYGEKRVVKMVIEGILLAPRPTAGRRRRRLAGGLSCWVPR